MERLLLSCVALAATVAFDRPLWVDEFGQFAFGSYHTVSEFWTMFQKTIQTQHNQTGVLYFINFASLNWLGAGFHVMRFPSYLAGFFLFWVAHFFFETQGATRIWRTLSVAALVLSPLLAEHVSEARSYIMLAASSMGVLTYYLLPSNQRSGMEARIIGWVSVLMGVSMHPFFPLYWVVAALIGVGHGWQKGPFKTSVRAAILHMHPVMVIVGSIVFFALGYLTWAGHQQEFRFHFDPFQFVHKDSLLLSVALSHFASGNPYIGIVLPIALSILALVFRQARTQVLVMFAALAVTALLVGVMVYKEYWIVPRQWLGSVPWATLAPLWGLMVLSDRLGGRRKWILPILLILAIAQPMRRQMRNQLSEWKSRPKLTALRKSFDPRQREVVPKDPDRWVELSNINCLSGGPVWPIFRKRYGEPGDP